jgi:NarL family two-component system response regulator LiaR
MRVICADDHDTIRKGVRAILADSFDDLIFDEAKNGEEAVRLAVANRPDLVILDINMPVLDGFGAAREIHERFSAVPILFFTMHSARALVSEAPKTRRSWFRYQGPGWRDVGRCCQGTPAKRNLFPLLT